MPSLPLAPWLGVTAASSRHSASSSRPKGLLSTVVKPDSSMRRTNSSMAAVPVVAMMGKLQP